MTSKGLPSAGAQCTDTTDAPAPEGAVKLASSCGIRTSTCSENAAGIYTLCLCLLAMLHCLSDLMNQAATQQGGVSTTHRHTVLGSNYCTVLVPLCCLTCHIMLGLL